MAFYSKSLSQVEQNYEIHNKEMLAIIQALEEWRHFLERAQHPVEIWTDHKNLEYFITAKKLNHCQAHWFLYLAHFNFKLIHCSSYSIGKPNSLLQRPDHGNRASNNENVVLLWPELLAIQALEGIQLEEPEKDILREICQGNKEGD